MDSISEVTLKSSNLNSAVPLIVILNRLFKRSVLTNEDIQKLGIKLAGGFLIYKPLAKVASREF